LFIQTSQNVTNALIGYSCYTWHPWQNVP